MQTFDGTNFSQYSSFVTSEADFNTYKNTGTQWWIVCSTLPPFSYSVNTHPATGAVNVAQNLQVNGVIQSSSNYGLVLSPQNGDAIINRSSEGNLVLCSHGASSDIRLNFAYGGGSGGVSIFDGGTQKHANLKVTATEI